jgi:hypothetical protein
MPRLRAARAGGRRGSCASPTRTVATVWARL